MVEEYDYYYDEGAAEADTDGTFFGGDGFTLDDIGGIFDTIGDGWNIWEDISGQTDPVAYDPNTVPYQSTIDPIWYWVGGIGVVLLVGVLIFLAKRKK